MFFLMFFLMFFFEVFMLSHTLIEITMGFH